MTAKKSPLSINSKSIFYVPALLLFICLIAFALLIPTLGFYWDDWLVIFHTQNDRMSDLVTLFSYDRPFSSWTAILNSAILGTSPFAWQLFSLIIRWLAILAMWSALRALWPQRSAMITWASILFAIYPAFSLQSISVVFSQHWIAYGLLFISLASMALAARDPARFLPYTLLSLLTAALHLVTLEYFAGLELIRPLFLYLLFSQSSKSKREIAKSIWHALWPFLSLWLLWAYWRLFIVQFPVEPHPLKLLLDLRANPLATVLSFIETVLKSLTNLLVNVWQQLLHPELIDVGDRFGLLIWPFAGLCMVAVYLLSSRLLQTETQFEDGETSKWSMVLGLFAILAGLLPVWLIGEIPLETGYNERFALPAMFGAALFWIGLLWSLIENTHRRTIVLSVMVGLAIAGHFRAANTFRLDWQNQQSYYAQIAWRAPAVKPNTALLFLEPITKFMPASSTSAAINTLYSQSKSEQIVDFWFFDLGLTRNVRVIEQAESFSSNYRGLLFQAEKANSFLFFYQVEGACLWLLSPLHSQNVYLSPEARQFAEFSNSKRIIADTTQSRIYESAIFDTSPKDTWCYYYQNADRLRQLGEWKQIIALMQEAERKNLNPNIGLEWLPLVEAHARLGDWSSAEQVSRQIQQKHIRNVSVLCALWEQLVTEIKPNENTLGSQEAISALAACESD